MRISDALTGISRLFLDTAPVIYFVERNPRFVDFVDSIFEQLEVDITAVASPITLSECLVGAIRMGLYHFTESLIQIKSVETAIYRVSCLSICIKI